MYVRWLGAFGKSNNLHTSLDWELSQTNKEVCAENILKNSYSNILHAKVGLLIPSSAVVKKFNGDCWSKYNNNNMLYKTRNPKNANSEHLEVFCKPIYKGIIIKGGYNPTYGFFNLPKKIRSTIKYFSKKYHLPIYYFQENGNIKIIDI